MIGSANRAMGAANRRSATKQVLLLSTCLAVGLPGMAHATDYTVATGTTQTVSQALLGIDTLTVQQGGAITVSTNNAAVNISGETSGAGVQITNSGTLSATADNANARGINSSGDFTNRNVTITNTATGIISGRGDGIRFNTTTAAGFAAPGSVITINNSGIIRSTGGGTTATGARGIFIATNMTGAQVNITNNAGGLIEGNLGIQSATDTTIVNSGTIRGLTGALGTGPGQAIRLTSNGTNTVTLNSGSITDALNDTVNAVQFTGTGTNTITVNGGASVNSNIAFTGSGTNTVNVNAGANIAGQVSFTGTLANVVNLAAGGSVVKGFSFSSTGLSDTLNLTGSGAGTLGVVSNLETLRVIGGDWTTNQNITGAASGSLTSATIDAGASVTFTDASVGGGSIRGPIVNNGTINFARTGTLAQNNGGVEAVMSGTGSFRVTGSGTYQFTSANTYSGVTSIENGQITAMVANTFSPNSAVVITDPGAMNLAGFSQTIASLAGTGQVKFGTTDPTATLTMGGSGASTTFSGVISGSGNIVKTGTGTLTLSGINTLTGNVTVAGGAVALSGAGNLANANLNLTGAGTAFDITAATAPVSLGSLSGDAGTTLALGANALTTTGATDTTFAGVVSGSGSLTKAGAGALTLSGANTLTGPINLNAGTLVLTGSTAGGINAAAATTVVGAGPIGGTLSLADGATLRIGASGVSTLTTGGLALSSTSILEYDLGAPGVLAASDRIQVNGDLVLDGRISASDAGSFGAGVYRLIDYTGTLTNNGLSIGALPAGFQTGQGTIQTAVSGQINLVVSSTLPNLQFWDGAGAVDDGIIAGGSGSWTNTATNWTSSDGTTNGAWQSGFAVFQGAAGTVTVDDPVVFTGLQFMTDGYQIVAGTGGLSTATADTSVRVDPGVTATISAPISGTGGLFKQDTGTLVLSGSNTYTDSTTVDGGTVSLVGGAAIADLGSVAVSTGATLAVQNAETIGSLGGTGSVVLNDGLTTGANNASSTFSGALSGAGGLTKVGTGTFTLNGANTFTGPTTVSAGRLVLGSAGSLVNSATVQVDPAGTLQLGVNKTLGSITGSGAIDLASFRLTVGSGTFSGVISGTAAGNGLTKNGTGTLTLAGANTYTGSTNVTGGTLVLTGSLAGAANVSGGATLTGTGTVGGILNVSTGRLAPGNGGVGTLTTGGLVLGSGAILDYDLGTPGVLAASDRIQVNGNLTLDGTLNATDAGGFGMGVYRLIDYTGTLTDNGLLVGTLPSGYTSSQATVQTSVNGQVNLVLAALIPNIQFWDGANTTSNNVIDGGSGSWTATGTNWADSAGAGNAQWGSKFAVFAGTAGTVTVDGPITFTGMQFMTDGYVIAPGTGTLTTADPAANLRVDPGLTATISAGIGGTGGIVKNDTGTLVLSGANTYAGATQVAFGTLRVLGGSAIPATSAVTVDASATLAVAASQTIGSLAGAGTVALSSGTLTTNGTNASTTFSGTITGTGGLAKTGTGTLTLTGANSYTGLTTVSAGTLTGDIGSGDLTIASGATFNQGGVSNAVGALTGAGAVVLGATSLSAGSATSSIYSGVMSGTGGLTKTGTGTLTLTGTNTYTGATTVAAGSLLVNGAIASAATVASGATLGGIGRVGATTVNGILAAGAAPGAIGTLTVNGALTFNAGSTLLTDVLPDGTGDRVIATGAVTINGGAVQVSAGGAAYSRLTSYTILSGSSVTGQFGSVSDNLAFLDTSLVYTPTSVQLQVLRNDVSFADVALTANQEAVGTALDSAATGAIGLKVLNFSATQAQQAFEGLSGEIHAATLATSSRNAAHDRRAVVERLAAKGEEGPRLWLDAGLLDRSLNARDGYAGFNSVRYNVAGGLEYGLGEAGKIGVAVNYGSDSFDLDAVHGSGTIKSTGVFAYGAFGTGPLSLRLGAGYGWLKTRTDRRVFVDTLSDRMTGAEKGTQKQVFGELGYALAAGDLTVEPFVGAAHVRTTLDGLAEQGTIAALTVGKARLKSTTGTAGVRLSGPLMTFGKTPLGLDAEFAADHAFDEPRALRTMTLANVPQSFVVGANMFDDTVFRTRIGFTTELGGGEFGAAFLGAFSKDQKEIGARLKMRWDF